jgi:hypothetical protein
VIRVGAIVMIVVAIVVAGCGGGGDRDGGRSGRLTVLSNVAPVEDAFNADKGNARLVLILSPT